MRGFCFYTKSALGFRRAVGQIDSDVNETVIFSADNLNVLHGVDPKAGGVQRLPQGTWTVDFAFQDCQSALHRSGVRLRICNYSYFAKSKLLTCVQFNPQLDGGAILV